MCPKYALIYFSCEPMGRLLHCPFSWGVMSGRAIATQSDRHRWIELAPPSTIDVYSWAAQVEMPQWSKTRVIKVVTSDHEIRKWRPTRRLVATSMHAWPYRKNDLLGYVKRSELNGVNRRSKTSLSAPLGLSLATGRIPMDSVPSQMLILDKLLFFISSYNLINCLNWFNCYAVLYVYT